MDRKKEKHDEVDIMEDTLQKQKDKQIDKKKEKTWT